MGSRRRRDDRGHAPHKHRCPRCDTYWTHDNEYCRAFRAKRNEVVCPNCKGNKRGQSMTIGDAIGGPKGRR